MKAFVVTSYGPTGLQLADVPKPTIGQHDVLVRVLSAGLNPLDKLVRDGEFKRLLRYQTPFILGHDVAGIVEEVGPGVTGVVVGQEVFSRPRDLRIGTLAEYIAVDQDDLAVKPTTLSFDEAAAVPLVALASWQAFVVAGKTQPGDKVLIHGGSGGLGSTAIQVAKHLGLHVATTCSAKHSETVRNLGADIVLDYRKDDFTKHLQDYDIVLDTVGGANLERSLDVLKPGGLALSVVGPPDADFASKLGNPLLKPIMGLLSRKIRAQARKKKNVRYSFFFMEASGSQLAHLASLYESGVLKPVVDRTFPFVETLEAMAYLESGRPSGKIVVSMQP